MVVLVLIVRVNKVCCVDMMEGANAFVVTRAAMPMSTESFMIQVSIDYFKFNSVRKSTMLANENQSKVGSRQGLKLTTF